MYGSRSGRHRESTPRRWVPARAGRFGLICVALILVGAEAKSAEIRVRSVDSCADASAITEQTESLLGRPLRAIEGVDFEVALSAEPEQIWKLRIDVISRPDGSRRSREITGRDCAALAEAAAVAIAMSADAELRETAASRPAQLPPPPAAATEPAPPAPRASASNQPLVPPIRPTIGLALAIDAGALPGTALGTGLQGSLRRGSLRLAVQAAFFPSDETRLANGIGGDFQLAVAGLLGCFAHGAERLTLSACGGGEIGSMAGNATGVLSPRLGSTLWVAGRAEAAAEVAFASRFFVFVQAGVALPARRPTFVVDRTVRVHQANGLTARSMVGIGIAF